MLLSKLKLINGAVKTKDSVKITIEIGKDKEDQKTQEEELTVQGEEYKGYIIKPDVETGEYDIYSIGGALVAHAATLELAQNYIDNVDIGI